MRFADEPAERNPGEPRQSPVKQPEVNVNVLEIAESTRAGNSGAGHIKTIAVCETKPVTAEGLRTLLDGCPDLRFGEAIDSLGHASMLLRQTPPDVLRSIHSVFIVCLCYQSQAQCDASGLPKTRQPAAVPLDPNFLDRP